MSATGARTVETLSGPPSLAGSFLRAVATGRGRSGHGPLPETVLELSETAVDRDKLAAYQQVCGMPVSDTLPHTYPHVLGFPLQAGLMARSGFPLPLAGLVHLENVITLRRRLTAADPLTVAVHAEDLRPHPRGTVVDLVTAVRCDGEPVWHGRSTYLSRGRGSADAPAGSPAPAIPLGPPAARWRLQGDLGRTYAGVSGDVNPIHLYPLTAKAMGFPRAIAHGMWTYARTLAALGPGADGPSTSHVWFRKPVLLPGSVELVVDKGSERSVTAGLRSARAPETEHLVLTLDCS
ncbi:MAG: MaoC/PaaZ C-terminal domain-containing protein [Dermatophilaceae bacterium]